MRLVRARVPEAADLLEGVIERLFEAEALEYAAAPVAEALGPLSEAFTATELVALGKRYPLEQLQWNWRERLRGAPGWAFEMRNGGRARRIIPPEECVHVDKSHVGPLGRCMACGAKFSVDYIYTLIQEAE